MSEEVRIATRADEQEIMQLLHVMHFENGMMPLDEECASRFFDLSFDRKGGIIGVIGEQGNIKAAISLLITRFWYTSTNHLEETFNFDFIFSITSMLDAAAMPPRNHKNEYRSTISFLATFHH